MRKLREKYLNRKILFEVLVSYIKIENWENLLVFEFDLSTSPKIVFIYTGKVWC